MRDIIITFNEPYFKVLEELLEYNTDTSARHSEMNDDIVQTTSKEEDVESWNKESMR